MLKKIRLSCMILFSVLTIQVFGQSTILLCKGGEIKGEYLGMDSSFVYLQNTIGDSARNKKVAIIEVAYIVNPGGKIVSVTPLTTYLRLKGYPMYRSGNQVYIYDTKWSLDNLEQVQWKKDIEPFLPKYTKGRNQIKTSQMVFFGSLGLSIFSGIMVLKGVYQYNHAIELVNEAKKTFIKEEFLQENEKRLYEAKYLITYASIAGGLGLCGVTYGIMLGHNGRKKLDQAVNIYNSHP